MPLGPSLYFSILRFRHDRVRTVGHRVPPRPWVARLLIASSSRLFFAAHSPPSLGSPAGPCPCITLSGCRAGHSLCHVVAGGTSSRMAAPEKVVFYIRKTPSSAR